MTRRTRLLPRPAACLAVALLLAGCAGLREPPPSGAMLPPDGRAAAVAPAPAPSAGTDGDAGPPRREPPTMLLGTDRQVRLLPRPPVTVSKGGAVSLRFEQAPVTEVVHAVLGDLLDIGYTVHQPLEGQVTLHTQAPLPPDQLLSLLESVLQANGILLVRDTRGHYHVGKPEALKGLGSAPHHVGSLPSGYGIVIVPLQFVGAAEMAEILKPVANADTFVRIDTLRNLLVLAGPRRQLDSWLEFIAIFDVDMLKGMSVGLFPLEYLSAQEMVATLRLLTGAGASPPPAPPAAPGTTARSVTRPAARPAPRAGAADRAEADAEPTTLGPFGSAVRVLPIERMNAVLVVTPRAHLLRTVREWVERFDRPHEGGSEPQLHVYPVKNGKAAHLATLLNAIFGGTQEGLAEPTDYGVAPGLQTGSLLGGGLAGGLTGGLTGGLGGTRGGPVSQALAAAGGDGRPGTGVTQATLPRDVRVVADELNNALLIHAPRAEYRKIQDALRRLDVVPTQVLIEASILEVTLTDETRFGLQWFLENGLGDGWTGSALLTDRATATIGPTTPGFSYSIINPLGRVRAVLNALAEKSLLNVVSSPSVMVLDNHTAAIHVGDQQPILASTTVTEGGTTISSIQYKDTGVILSVTPSANAGGMVSMVIRQAVTDVGPVDSATGQRSFLQREVSSRVAVRSGETLVLGGLMRDNNSREKQGVPLLHDIPLLGPLFGVRSDSTLRTELLVMITPRVVRSDQDVRDAGAELRRRMQGLRVLPGWERYEEAPRQAPVPRGAPPPGGDAGRSEPVR